MAEEENTEEVIEDQSTHLEDVSSIDKEEPSSANITMFVKEKYKKAEDARRTDEQRWLRSYRNYRGLYGSDVQFSEAEKSRVFIKITKTKTLAAYSQIVDVLFAGNKFPISVEPTELPEGVSEDVHIDIEKPNKELAEKLIKNKLRWLLYVT